MNPVSDFTRMVLRHRPEPRFYPRAALYFLKLAAWEPFRWGEALADRLAQGARSGKLVSRQLPEPPVFILGYYRSGTTHLQEVMLRDPRFGYMNFYHGFFPTAFTSTEAWIKPVFEAIIRATGFLHPAHQIPFSFHLPAEDDVAMVASGSELAANWGQVFPRRFKEIYARTGLLEDIAPEEQAELERQLHDLLWRVSRANGHKRLLLKSPPHTGRLGMLARMYPGARFVFIRRHPYEVFASNLKLWRSFEGQHLERIGPDEVRDHIVWSHDAVHRAYERDKVGLAPGQLCEVTFEGFMDDPVATLEHIYDTLQLGGFESCRDAFTAYLDARHAPRRSSWRLPAADRALVDARLGHWMAAWGYEEDEPARARVAAGGRMPALLGVS